MEALRLRFIKKIMLTRSLKALFLRALRKLYVYGLCESLAYQASECVGVSNQTHHLPLCLLNFIPCFLFSKLINTPYYFTLYSIYIP